MSVASYSYQLQPARVRVEFFRLLPISLFVVAFGAAFGLAATQKGLEPLQAVLMSATVFAGASQFAAVDMWGTEVSVLPMIAVVFAINSRHLLMGASLYPMLKDVSPGKRYGLLLLLTDANWAVSAQEYQSGRRNLEVILGGGLALWLAWIIGTGLGVYFGGLLQDPKSLGLDMVLGCFLLAMALGGKKSPRVLVAWTVTALASLAAWKWLPANTHVVVGALAGGAIGFFWLERKPAPASDAEDSTHDR
ncbi:MULTISPECIES: AzlC family ABC transporter permease [Marinobacter]|jgi:predicted branched-subunit amino acid permease|uniref:AzlC family ABC transporter permease n=4 Tax=Marinobacter TaxID=2742 RepID=A0ABX8ILK2_9GAMM|nr:MULTISPECIES: AzlC family ABC transporter permease [Marinobacter]MCP4062445.1 AzlC family ABC transporter permease [Gammaproteobacteria bacterium]ADP98386.1 AzlC family protein [Marinobacter adhaerens HP15]AKV95289.1 branched-chain amino acid ABC transporter permease [Marinobacter sp. CP1]EHJ04097.1 AzlC family protein [Marinobacter manganoxydans MnI7-9]MAK48603.1 branched-chain amino acid ABC transporter permease [Marinobacter sp.]|tara:strand:+ start:1208 stop:1954 length:747 start_codon:yes stop_codon:yes gene_type:complete